MFIIDHVMLCVVCINYPMCFATLFSVFIKLHLFNRYAVLPFFFDESPDLCLLLFFVLPELSVLRKAANKNKNITTV